MNTVPDRELESLQSRVVSGQAGQFAIDDGERLLAGLQERGRFTEAMQAGDELIKAKVAGIEQAVAKAALTMGLNRYLAGYAVQDEPGREAESERYFREAIALLERATPANSDACAVLGYMHQHGEGCEADPVAATRWYLQGAADPDQPILMAFPHHPIRFGRNDTGELYEGFFQSIDDSAVLDQVLQMARQAGFLPPQELQEAPVTEGWAEGLPRGTFRALGGHFVSAEDLAESMENGFVGLEGTDSIVQLPPAVHRDVADWLEQRLTPRP